LTGKRTAEAPIAIEGRKKTLETKRS